jgi:hypothetical protein
LRFHGADGETAQKYSDGDDYDQNKQVYEHDTFSFREYTMLFAVVSIRRKNFADSAKQDHK